MKEALLYNFRDCWEYGLCMAATTAMVLSASHRSKRREEHCWVLQSLAWRSTVWHGNYDMLQQPRIWRCPPVKKWEREEKSDSTILCVIYNSILLFIAVLFVSLLLPGVWGPGPGHLRWCLPILSRPWAGVINLAH